MGKGLPRSLARAKGDNAVKVRKYVVKDVAVALTATGSAKGIGTAVIGDLPEGNVLLLGATSYFTMSSTDTDLNAAFEGDYSIGTTPTADATLDSTDANIIPSTDTGAASARAITTPARGANATAAMLNNTDGSLELNLNLTIDAASMADDSAASMTVNGVVYVAYAVLGDD